MDNYFFIQVIFALSDDLQVNYKIKYLIYYGRAFRRVPLSAHLIYLDVRFKNRAFYTDINYKKFTLPVATQRSLPMS
jgi:hypothetical protein